MPLDLATSAFWLFLAVVVGSLIWRKTLHRREVLITLRTAIEKGLPLDDERLQALLGATVRQPRRVTHDFFLVFGAVLVTGAVCLGVLALFAPEPAPLVVIGVCAAVAAVACLTLWRIFAQREKHNGAGQ